MQNGKKPLFADHLGNLAANEYADYNLDNPESDQALTEILNKHLVTGTF